MKAIGNNSINEIRESGSFDLDDLYNMTRCKVVYLEKIIRELEMRVLTIPNPAEIRMLTEKPDFIKKKKTDAYYRGYRDRDARIGEGENPYDSAEQYREWLDWFKGWAASGRGK